MEYGAEITPEEYVEQVAALVTSERVEEALAFGERYSTTILPQLTAEQFDLTTGLLEAAQLTVDLEQISVVEYDVHPLPR
jgi:hypothetical protein